MWIPLIALIVGIIIGLKANFVIPADYAKYMSVAVLAALDSVFGGIRAGMEGKYENRVFLTGFFSNALLAAGLAYVGERVGVELYTAAIFAFGVRLFTNLALIRRYLLRK